MLQIVIKQQKEVIEITRKKPRTTYVVHTTTKELKFPTISLARKEALRQRALGTLVKFTNPQNTVLTL